jgi:hypothetical protein
MMPKHSFTRRRRAFAMHDDFAFHAFDDVLFFPREIVVVSGAARPHCDCLPRFDPQSIAP